MYIKDLHIDGFGIYHDTRLHDIPRGLSLFIGENEAGKSTCMEFLRTMLTDFPQSRNRILYPPLRGGRFGGSLSVVLDDGEELLLSRYRDRNTSQLSLSGEGKELNPNRLTELLAGVTRESYARVFGFSLQELEQKLSPSDVQDALYSATFGANLRDPNIVLKNFAEFMGKRFSPRGKKGELNHAAIEFFDQERAISDLTAENAEYDELIRRQATLSKRLNNVTQERRRCEEEHRQLELRLNVWEQWEEWQTLGMKLAEFPPEVEYFPDQGTERLEQVQQEERAKQYALARQEQKYTSLAAERDGITIDTVLVQELPVLERLSEQKGIFRDAELRLLAQSADCRRKEDELKEKLLRLGADWSCERIRRSDLSLFSHNELEATAIELHAASTAHEAAVMALESCNRDVLVAKEALEQAQQASDQIVLPGEMLSDSERNSLRQDLARFEEATRQIPEKEEIRRRAVTGFQQAWDRLQMHDEARNDPKPILQILLKEQERVRSLATRVEENLSREKDAENSLAQMDSRIREVSKRRDALKEMYQDEAPDRAILDREDTLLKRARFLLETFRQNENALGLLEDELRNEPLPIPSKIFPLMLLGGILAVLGSSMLIMNLFFQITSIPLTDHLSLPMDLWSGYFVLFAGVLGIWGGLPHDGNDVRRRQMDRLKKEEHAAELKRKLSHQKHTMEELATELSIETCTEETLEDVEARIRQGREHCIRSEHYQNALHAIQRELESMEDDRLTLEDDLSQKTTAVQHAKLAWHECLRELGLKNIPDAARAQTFLTRVEMAQMSFDALQQAEQSCSSLLREKAELVQHMAGYPAIAEELQKETEENGTPADAGPDAGSAEAQAADGEEEIPRTVRICERVLAGMREADRLREQKNLAEAGVERCRKEFEHAGKRREDADRVRSRAETRLQTIMEQWGRCLQTFGLSKTMNPKTASEALQCMQDCLVLERAVANSRDVLSQITASLKAFSDPLKAVLSRTERPEIRNPDGSTDWLATFESVYTEARAMEQLGRDLEQLNRRVREEKTELDMCVAEHEKALESIRKLLRATASETIESFLVKAREHAEVLEAKTQRKTLESNLKIAAAKQDFHVFLASFEENDRASQEQYGETLKNTLNDLSLEETSLRKELASVDAKIDILSQREDLGLLLQRHALLRKNMEETAFEWARHALAFAILQKTRETFEQDRQPAVLRTASDIFQRITHGNWKRIVISLDAMKTVRMLSAKSNELVPPEALSRGTQEQAYMALRLAYILSHAEFAESLPLLMDEVFVNFDRTRAQSTAEEIIRIANGVYGKPHQILYFTCHPEIVDLFRQLNGSVGIFRVDNGTITQDLS